MPSPVTTQGDLIEELCRRDEGKLLGHLIKLVGRKDIAQELMQDAFVRLHQLHQRGQVTFPRSLLFKVATNFALMYLRRQRCERAMFVDPVADPEDDWWQQIEEVIPDSGLGPERQAMAHQITPYLTAAVTALRPTLRQPFVMAHVQGKPRKEIASALGISEKRLDKRMTKALSECRSRLTELGIDPTKVFGLILLLQLTSMFCVWGT